MVKSPSDSLEKGEGRQHQRFMVPKGTFVIVSPGADNEWKVQAIDISHGGLAFVYQGSQNDLDSSGVLKILHKNVDLENLNFETVSDVPLSVSKDTPLPSRRRGVKFTWLGVLDKQDVRDFVDGIRMSGPIP